MSDTVRMTNTNGIEIICKNPFQMFAYEYIRENFTESGIASSTFELLENGIRMTDSNGDKADFLYNYDTGRIVFKEVDSKQLRREKQRKRNVQLIQRDLLRTMGIK